MSYITLNTPCKPQQGVQEAAFYVGHLPTCNDGVQTQLDRKAAAALHAREAHVRHG